MSRLLPAQLVYWQLLYRRAWPELQDSLLTLPSDSRKGTACEFSQEPKSRPGPRGLVVYLLGAFISNRNFTQAFTTRLDMATQYFRTMRCCLEIYIYMKQKYKERKTHAFLGERVHPGKNTQEPGPSVYERGRERGWVETNWLSEWGMSEQVLTAELYL